MGRLQGIAAVALLATGLAACADSANPVDADFDSGQGTNQEVRFQQYRQRWSAAGIRDYRMTVKLHGAWIGGAAVIQVRDGVPVSVSPVHPGKSANLAVLFRHYDTVEELFAVIQNALEHKAERLEVNYNRSVGVPVYADVDIRFSWADDEHGFAVEDFRVLK